MAKAKEQEATQQSQSERGEGIARRESSRSELSRPSMRSASPFALMNRFADEMERIFEDFGFGRGFLAPRLGYGLGRGRGEMGRTMWTPQIEAFEREGQFIVRADLPGLKKEDVNIEITDDAIMIRGERRQEHEEEREGYYRSERNYGSFFRSIPLPEGVNADDARANFRDGVLEITMPAPQRSERRRQLEIK